MERISYDEAREWFWVRTAVWTVVAALASAMAFFACSGDLVKGLHSRTWLSVGAGILSVLLGLAAATISFQFPWMRGGWRRGFVLNSPACTAISGLMAFLVCGVILSFMQNDPMHQPSPQTVQVAYSLMQFGTGASAFWGFIFGSWFSMRRDKYFVEPI